MSDNTYNPALHRFALLTAAATFPLIWIGGLVTTRQAGMSVPDWPTSYGYWFWLPLDYWVGGIAIEHLHRLVASGVGILAIILCVLAWRTESRASVRWLATGVLAAVIFQGVLGGLRVIWVNLDLAIVHACFAQAFFCLAALMCVVTSRWWVDRSRDASSANDNPASATGNPKLLLGLAVTTVVLIYLQLIAGALTRHYEAGLAIPDLPLAYGQWLPPTDSAALDAVNQDRAWNMNLSPVTLTQVWMHFSHRVGAVIVSGVVIALAVVVLRRHRHLPHLTWPGMTLLALLLIQLTLGVLSVLYRRPNDVTTAHVAVGALLLVTAFVLSVRAFRIYSPLIGRKTAPASRPGPAASPSWKAPAPEIASS